ncbi:MAG TPA: hypothetical protein VF338_10410 [Leptolinea sp.]
MRKIYFITCLVLFVATISGCNIPVKATPTVSQDQVMTVVAGQLTEIAIKTAAAPKTSTPTFQPTAIKEPSPTAGQTTSPATLVPTVDFTGHAVFVSYLDQNKTLQISITVPNGIQGDYTATLGGKTYNCFSYTSKKLDRIICIGPLLRPELSYQIQVFHKGGSEVIFERMVSIPNPPS